MVYQYVVSLRNQHNKYIDLLGIFLSIASVLFFVRELILDQYTSIAYWIGAIFVSSVLIWNLVQSSKGKKVYYSRALLIAALVWMKMPFLQWLAFLFIMLALLEYQAKYSLEIGFSDKEIVVNSLWKKRYQWSQFTQILLKDGLLTLDFANNRIFQREVDDDEEDDADEEEFNTYCLQQIKKSSNPSGVAV